MLVEILHTPESSGVYNLVQTLDVVATSDVAACELAYYHTKEGSIAHLQNPHVTPTSIGDIIAVVPDVDDRTTLRMFLLDSVEPATDTPIFSSVDPSSVKLGVQHGNH